MRSWPVIGDWLGWQQPSAEGLRRFIWVLSHEFDRDDFCSRHDPGLSSGVGGGVW
jgi:hypothetical protein